MTNLLHTPKIIMFHTITIVCMYRKINRSQWSMITLYIHTIIGWVMMVHTHTIFMYEHVESTALLTVNL